MLISYHFDSDKIQIDDRSYDMRDPLSLLMLHHLVVDMIVQASIGSVSNEDLAAMAEMLDTASGCVRTVTRATQIIKNAPSAAQVESSSRKQIWSRLSGFLLLVRHLLRF
jgi:hypothetical protein